MLGKFNGGYLVWAWKNITLENVRTRFSELISENSYTYTYKSYRLFEYMLTCNLEVTT